MATLVHSPKVGANVTEGTVGAWHKREGDPVARGEPLVEIITSKATFDVESPAEGVLRRALAPEKSALPVGYILAILGAPDEPLPDAEAENARLMAAFRAQARETASGPIQPPKVKATPGARRLAAELGLDLAAAAGSGVIREDDVRRAAAAKG